VDFVVDTGGRLELFEAELPDAGDTVNLDFVRNVVGKSRVTGAVRSSAAHQTAPRFPMDSGHYL